MYFAAQGLPPGLAMDPATGDITGTVGLGDAGFAPYLVTVTATDGTNADSQSFNWNINSAVTLTAPADQTSSEGGSASLSLSATYSGSGSLSYAAFGLPPGLKISASSGDITGTVAVGVAADGPYYVTVIAAAGDSSAEESFNWTVNSPITLTDPVDQTNNEGASISLSLSATDATSGTLTYAAEGLPGGLEIIPSTGHITGTLAAGDAGDGPYSVTVLAQDGTYSTSQTFNWTVNSAITITTPADQTNNEGDSVSLSISASDATSGATMVYAALGLPPGLVISPTTGTITGTITTGSSANGPYTVTIGVTDSSTFAETSFNWNVNSPITINTPPDQTNNAGDTVSLAISASDAASGTLTFSATGLPSGLSINTSTGAITGTISDGGSYQPTITATDGTYTGSTTFNWSVSSPIAITDQGDQTNNDGDTGVSVQISATDNASGTVSFSASGLPSGLSINSSTGAITGTVGSSADTSSPYTSVITVTDGTNTAIDTFTWYVNPSDPVVVFNPGSQTNADGDMVALPIEASDSTAGATLYYAVSGLPAGLNYNPATGLIFGTISSSADTGSPYTVTVTVGDNTNSASTSFTWTVNTAGTVTMVNPGDQTNSEGDSVSVSVSASDASSGTLHYVAFGLPAGLKINAIGAITGTVAIGDSGESPYTVTLVANDGTYSAEQTFYWNVNSAISIVQPLDQTNNEGDTVSLSISACGGTPSYAVLGLPPGLKINPSTGAITGTIATGSAADGPYSVTILAVDGTNSATMSFNWNVNSPITINVPDTQTNNDGDASISVAVSATDTTSGTVVFSAVGLPPGLTINSSTGAITGGIIVGDSSIGTFEPTIIANDGTYATSASFEWDVNGVVSLSISGPSELSNVVGDTVNLGVVALDTESGTLSYAATGLPMGLGIDKTTGAITGTISSTAASIGTFDTTVTVSDGTSSASTSFTWIITAAGSLTLATPSNQTSVEGNTISTLSLSASGSGTITYFALDLPPGLALNPSSGDITGTVAVNDAAYGAYTVTVIATNGSASASETFTWTVSSPVSIDTIATQTYTEGGSVSLSVASSDSSSGTLVFGAIGLPAGLKVSKTTGDITGTVALGSAGTFTVTILAGDGTYSSSQTFTINVGGQITIAPIADQPNYELDTVSLSVSATDSSSGTMTYSAVGLPAGLSINTSTGAITGTISVNASANGPYNVTVTASDGTYSASQTFTWTVNNPIAFPTPPSSQVGVSGEAITALLVNASNADGGTINYVASELPAGLSINHSTGLITGTIDPSVLTGVYFTTVTATNGTFSGSVTIRWVVLSPADLVTTIVLLQEKKQQLVITTDEGPQVEAFGKYDWPVVFILTMNSPKGGIIIQHVVIERMIPGQKPYKKEYWEAWVIKPNTHEVETILNYTDKFWVEDEAKIKDGTAKYMIKGDAIFYEGMTMPASFKPRNVTEAGTLPSTATDPKIDPKLGTAPLIRMIKLSWDKSGDTKIVERIPKD